MTRSGDAGFDEWVSPALPMLHRYATALVGADDGPDLVQETLVRAWKRRGTYDPASGSTQAWLAAILRDRARQRWRRRSPPSIVAGVSPPPDSLSDGVIARLDLREAVMRLPTRQRESVVLHYYVDLSVEEVATVMGVTAGTVKSQLSDARRSLVGQLGGSNG